MFLHTLKRKVPAQSVGDGPQLAAVVSLRRRVGIIGEPGHVAHVRAGAVDGGDPPQGRVGHGDGGPGCRTVSDAGPGQGQGVTVRIVGHGRCDALSAFHRRGSGDGMVAGWLCTV